MWSKLNIGHVNPLIIAILTAILLHIISTLMSPYFACAVEIDNNPPPFEGQAEKIYIGNKINSNETIKKISILTISESDHISRYIYYILTSIELVKNVEFIQNLNGEKSLIYYSMDNIIKDKKINVDLLNIKNPGEIKYLQELTAMNNECHIHIARRPDKKHTIIAFDNTKLNTEDTSLTCFLLSVLVVFYGKDMDFENLPTENGELLIFTLNKIRDAKLWDE